MAGLFDEIVVVDTGSKDRTREIAREFGARVFDFVWVDDFAAARNAALARATGDYAFWLDADDVVDPPEREKLRKLLDGLPGGRGGGRGSPVGLARTFDPPCYGWTCQAGRCLRLPECVISALEWHALANIHDGSGIL